jgi:hypothetical protein
MISRMVSLAMAGMVSLGSPRNAASQQTGRSGTTALPGRATGRSTAPSAGNLWGYFQPRSNMPGQARSRFGQVQGRTGAARTYQAQTTIPQDPASRGEGKGQGLEELLMLPHVVAANGRLARELNAWPQSPSQPRISKGTRIEAASGSDQARIEGPMKIPNAPGWYAEPFIDKRDNRTRYVISFDGYRSISDFVPVIPPKETGSKVKAGFSWTLPNSGTSYPQGVTPQAGTVMPQRPGAIPAVGSSPLPSVIQQGVDEMRSRLVRKLP